MTPPRVLRQPSPALVAGLAYTILAVVYTWPLAAGLTRDVPWDLGDALLNDWILGWHYHQVGRVLAGDWSAVAAWWQPPLFHPAPYTIAYSELLVTQAVLGAPIFALTGNLLLTYNVLFIGSFAASGLGAFLLVREMTGDTRAAWVAGLLYGFALYRVAQAPHLQALHAQWAPLVLYFLHRYFARGRWRSAIWAGVALAAQNLSNGYYLFYVALLLPPYCVAQIAMRGRWRDWRAWAGPAVAASVALLLTVPLMYPYFRLRAVGGGARPLAAVAFYGADTQAWVTASEALRLWGWLRTVARPEGELFPGVTLILLAGCGLVLHLATRIRSTPSPPAPLGAGATPPPLARWRQVVLRGVTTVATVSLAWHTTAITLALLFATDRLTLGPLTLSFGNGRRLLVLWALSLAVLLLVSRRARAACRDTPNAPVVTLTALALLTVWLSFGPVVRTGGRQATSWPELYGVVYSLLPGADALRVPPRIAMMTALLASMLAGIGVAAWRRRRHVPDALIALLSVAVLAEAWVAPIPMNLPIDAGAGLAAVPTDVPPRPERDPDAMALAALPRDAVLVELPIGSLPYEIRWQYLSAGHWRPRVNGYSGGTPADYVGVEQVLGALPDRGDEAWALLRARGVTHVVLHSSVWRDPARPEAIRQWLAGHGATPVAVEASLDVWAIGR